MLQAYREERDQEMSKGKLTFKLPDEQAEFEHAYNGPKWRAMVQQLDNRLRDSLKYDEKLSIADRTAIELTRSLIQRGLDENNLQLWD